MRGACLVAAHFAGMWALWLDAANASYMDCGSNVSLCGVLTLESGLGSGAYEHDVPCVHGLWPETGGYGTSDCVEPDSTSDPTQVYSCYEGSADDDSDVISFEVHEWQKHGECAGIHDEDDYFTQVCQMALSPIKIMTAMRNQGGNIDDMKSAVAAAGYEVYEVDTANAQLLLSACATPDGKWILAPVDSFSEVCGGWTNDSREITNLGSCGPNFDGPPCTRDDDCIHLRSCIRCAPSGYCTHIPLSTPALE